MGNCQCTNADDAVLRVPNNGLGGGLDDDDSTSLFSAASHWSEMGSPQTQKMRERNVRRNKELEACRARHFELTKKTDAANAELSALEAAKVSAVGLLTNLRRDLCHLQATACANIDFNEAKLDETTVRQLGFSPSV